MFQDERINKESGRIYRNCIILSLIITLIFLIIKTVYYRMIDCFQFIYILPESVLLIESLIILGVGEGLIINKTKDELFYFKRYNYYKKAMINFLSIGLLGFSISLPFEFEKKFMDLSSMSYLIHLESLGFLFLVFSFKRARINFNYSFIEESTAKYWKNVALNVLKLFNLHVLFFGISMLINIVSIKNNYLNVCLFFIISFASLSILYILLSFIEWLSNKYIENDRKNPAIFVVGGLTFFIYFLYFVCIFVVLFLQKNPATHSGTLWNVLNNISDYIHLFYLPCFIWLLTFLYEKLDKNKSLDLGITLFSTLALVQLSIGLCSSEVLMIVVENMDLNKIQNYNLVINLLSSVFRIGMGISLTYILYQIFLKTKKNAWWIVVPIFFFTGLVLRVLSYYFLQQILFTICSCLELAVIGILMVFIQNYNNSNE